MGIIILALIGAVVIGITLGLLGSGGSIMTVPILIYLLQRPDKVAIAESLAIVFSIAAFTAAPYALRGQVHLRSVLFFGLTGVCGAYLGAYIGCYCPEHIQMALFASVMLTAAAIMLFGPKLKADTNQLTDTTTPSWLLALKGVFVGALTGLLGIGGGFLIVPALVLICKLPMRYAVGTSLVIIAMNTLTGFLVQWTELAKLEAEINWHVIGIFALFGIVGGLFGSYVSAKIPQTRLRQIFAGFIVVVALYMLLAER